MTVAAIDLLASRPQVLPTGDAWHLTNRLLCKLLSHTLAISFIFAQGLADLRQLVRLFD